MMTKTDAPPATDWKVDTPTLDLWPHLQPGTPVAIVKRSPAGENRVRYPGEVVRSTVESPWIEIEARWTTPKVTQAQLTFEPGDVLRELFSPVHPFNAFAVYRPCGELKGWYANVTFPTLVESGDDRPDVIWHDLYIDVVASPDGEAHVLDEDELRATDLEDTDPALHARILAARDELLARFEARQTPFHKSVISHTESDR